MPSQQLITFLTLITLQSGTTFVCAVYISELYGTQANRTTKCILLSPGNAIALHVTPTAAALSHSDITHTLKL